MCALPISFSVACAVIYGTFLACIRLIAPVAPPDLIVTLGLEPRVQGKCSRTRPGPRLALAKARLAGVTSWKDAVMRLHGPGEWEIGFRMCNHRIPKPQYSSSLSMTSFSTTHWQRDGSGEYV